MVGIDIVWWNVPYYVCLWSAATPVLKILASTAPPNSERTNHRKSIHRRDRFHRFVEPDNLHSALFDTILAQSFNNAMSRTLGVVQSSFESEIDIVIVKKLREIRISSLSAEFSRFNRQ